MRALNLQTRPATRRALSAFVALATTLAYVPLAQASEPPEDESADDADAADGETTDGAEGEEGADEAPAEGEETEGEEAEGEAAEGEEAEGEETEGEEASEEEEAPAEEEEAPAEEEETPVEEEAAPAPVVAPEPEDERGPPPMYGEREAKGKGLLIAGGAVTAGGLAFLGASIAVTRCDPQRPNCPYGDQERLLIPSAIAVTGVGVMLLVAGGINMARYKKWERGELKTTYVAPSMMRGGAGVTAVGRF